MFSSIKKRRDGHSRPQSISPSVEVDTHSEATTSCEGPLLLHDDVELRRGGRRQQRHLSLFSNALLVSNTEYSNLAKEDQPKSISLDIFTEDIKKCTSPVTITVKTSDTVKDVIHMCLKVLGVTGSEDNYELWVTSEKEKTLHPLIGNEHPYGLKMSHLPDPLVPQELQDAIFPFILKPRRLPRNQQSRDSWWRRFKKGVVAHLACWTGSGN